MRVRGGVGEGWVSCGEVGGGGGFGCGGSGAGHNFKALSCIPTYLSLQFPHLSK